MGKGAAAGPGSSDDGPVTVTTSASERRTRVAPAPLRLGLAALAGVVMALAFPPTTLLGGWAVVPALALLLGTMRGASWRLGAGLGLAAGLGCFLVLLGWMRVLGPDAWIVLALLCAAFWAATGAALPWLLARRWWVVTVPLAWGVQESLRERIPFGGFPWGRLAFAQADTALAGWAALGGPPLVTLGVALAASTLLALVLALAEGGRPLQVAAAATVLVALPAIGAGLLGRQWGGTPTSTEPIAIVQGNVPRVGLDFNAQRRAVLDNHVRVTEELAAAVAAGEAEQPVAVIWPENSSDIDPLRNPDAAAQIDRAADAIGAPILVGAVLRNPDDPPTDDDPGTILNVALVWDPVTGPGDRYVKRRPVPFGEYLPFRDLLTRFISRFERIPRDFAPGDEPGFLQVGPVPLGVVICFEIAWDDLVRDAVRAGGQVLVVQTNNATYGLTGQPEQQLAISRLQAIAAGRTTLVAATSGISAVIAPDGSLPWRTEQFVADATVAQVPLRSGLTPAVRLGPWAEVGAVVLLLVLVAANRRQAQSSTKTSSPSTTTA
jgi:apolipoprotein N-acyltransferase